MRPRHRELLLRAKAQLCISSALICVGQGPGNIIYNGGLASTQKSPSVGMLLAGSTDK